MTCFRMENGESVRKYCLKNHLKYERVYYFLNLGFSVDESICLSKRKKSLVITNLLNELKEANKNHNFKKAKETRFLISKVRGKKC